MISHLRWLEDLIPGGESDTAHQLRLIYSNLICQGYEVLQSTSMSFFQSDADACHDADRRKDRFEGQHHREKLLYIWKLRSCMPWAWVTAYSRGKSTSVTTTRVVPSVDSEIEWIVPVKALPTPPSPCHVPVARPPSSFIYHLSPHPPHPNPQSPFRLHLFIWCGTTSMSLDFRCVNRSQLY